MADSRKPAGVGDGTAGEIRVVVSLTLGNGRTASALLKDGDHLRIWFEGGRLMMEQSME